MLKNSSMSFPRFLSHSLSNSLFLPSLILQMKAIHLSALCTFLSFLLFLSTSSVFKTTLERSVTPAVSLLLLRGSFIGDISLFLCHRVCFRPETMHTSAPAHLSVDRLCLCLCVSLLAAAGKKCWQPPDWSPEWLQILQIRLISGSESTAAGRCVWKPATPIFHDHNQTTAGCWHPRLLLLIGCLVAMCPESETISLPFHWQPLLHPTLPPANHLPPPFNPTPQYLTPRPHSSTALRKRLPISLSL